MCLTDVFLRDTSKLNPVTFILDTPCVYLLKVSSHIHTYPDIFQK